MSGMRLSLLAVTTVLAVVGVAAPATAAPGDQSVSSPVTTDGWYAVSSTCADGVGCAALPSLTSYPVGTLHVGTSMTGAEEARTYLRLDLSRLPLGAQTSGGTLTLPVAPAADGTSAAATAKLRVCLATAEFDPAAEGAADPPAIDCTTSTPAVLDAGATRFTADLAPLAGLLRADTSRGLAIVPAADSTGQWRVAMSSSTRQGAATAAPSARVTFSLPAGPPTSTNADTATIASDVRPVGRPLVAPAAALAPVMPVGTQPQATPTTAPLAPPVVDSAPAFAPVETAGRFAYPSVFLVPIALLAGAGWSVRAFTRDLLAPTA